MIKNLVWPFYRPIIMAVLVSLGICGCSKVDMPDEVISSYQKAIRINPGLAEAHFNLAIAYNSRTMLDEAISALVKAGVKVLCTQMTSKCSADLETIRSKRRTISRPARSTRSESRSAGRHSRHVACFGSVIAEVSSQAVRISNLATFEQDMASFAQVSGFAPLCSFLN